MKVAMISPLQRGGAISKYAYTLFKALRKDVQITLFHNSPMADIFQEARDDNRVERVQVEDFEDKLEDYDLIHFQLGNSPFHHFENHLLLACKGSHAKLIGTIHDPTLRGGFVFWCRSCWKSVVLPSIPTIIKNAAYFLPRGPLDRIWPSEAYVFPYKVMDLVWPRKMDGLIFTSMYLESYVRSKIEFSCPSKVIKYVGHLRETEARARSSGRKNKERRVPTLFIPTGYLELVKAVDIVIEALSKVPSKFRLVIPGEGTQKERLQSMVKRYGLSSEVEFVGYLREEKFMKQLIDSDIILTPRRISCGEVSSGMIHALSEGKPLIAANIGAFPEYLEGGHGLLCSPTSIDSWKDSMQKLIEHDQPRDELSRKAREFVKKELSPGKIAREHIKFYDRILSCNRRNDSTTRFSTSGCQMHRRIS